MVVVRDVVFSSVPSSKAFVVGGYMTGQRQVAEFDLDLGYPDWRGPIRSDNDDRLSGNLVGTVTRY